MNELPTILTSTYSSAALQPVVGNLVFDSRNTPDWNAQHAFQRVQLHPHAILPSPEEPIVTARIVKVVIADPNDNLPLEKRMLYSGPEKFTDCTDQELFFEVPIQELLAQHNEVRTKTVDKKQAEKFGRDIFLEAAKIRDLKMVVVTVATF